jgi:hypothetical protein
LTQLVGLSATEMGGPGVTVHFKIVRSAGTLTCEGWFDDGKGSGHFTYQPNPDFVAELAKRGINAPTGDLVRLRDHGVDRDYIASLREAGYEHLSLQTFAGPATTA